MDWITKKVEKNGGKISETMRGAELIFRDPIPGVGGRIRAYGYFFINMLQDMSLLSGSCGHASSKACVVIMVDKIRIGYFLGDRGHEIILKSFVARAAKEKGLKQGEWMDDVRAATGGKSIQAYRTV